MIDLPDYPSPRDITPALIDYGAVLQPSLGGPIQKLNRLGSRFRLNIIMPPMPSGKLGRQWVARLVRGKFDGVRMELPAPSFDPGVPGDIRVNGAGQSGSSLVVDGATPNYIAREGQFFSIETAGTHHLYMVAAETIFNSSGQATVPIAPMLRRQHADNDLCHFGKPMIEGLIMGDEFAWQVAVEHITQIEFAITEAQ